MSDTNQIIEKAQALSGKEEKPDAPEHKRKSKRKGVWAPFCEPQIESTSNVGVIITERIRGKPEYSVSFMHFDDRGPNRYISLPIEGEHELEDVVYSLALKAKAIIAARRQELGRAPRPPKPQRPERKHKPGLQKSATGLSAVVEQDARAAGKPKPEGKTARKRKKGKR